MIYGYVYKTTNLINGRIYIGQHKSNGWDEQYIGSGKILEVALKKYGRKNFVCEIIESCKTKEELNQKEIYWIAFYREKNNCYNITNGGEGRAASHSEETRKKLSKSLTGRVVPKEARENMSNAHKGIRVSEESKLKISKALKGRPFSEKHKENLSKSHMGISNPHSKEWREKVSRANKGRIFNESSKQKMSLSHKGENHYNHGKHLSVETRHKISEANKIANEKLCKRVEQICYKTQEVVAQYDSIAEAEKQTGINRAYISRLCHGKGKQCFGYTWRFVTRPPISWQYVEELRNE